MRTCLFVAMLGMSAGAAWADGLPSDRFAETWVSPAPGTFCPGLPTVSLLKAHAVALSDRMDVRVALAADDAETRRELALNAMASGWDQAQRSALQRLRDAQHAYAMAAESLGHRDDRDVSFVARLGEVVEGTGRSVAAGDVHEADIQVDQAYVRTLQAAPSEARRIEASERAWIAYRDAFGDFAQAIDRPDAARAIKAELAHRRLGDLQAAPASPE